VKIALKSIGRVSAACVLAFAGVACSSTSSIVRAVNDCQANGTSSSNVSLGGEIFSLSPKSAPARFVAAVTLDANATSNGIRVAVEDDNNLTKNSILHKNDQVGMLGALQCTDKVALFVPTQMTLNAVALPATPSPTPSAQPTKK